MEQNSYPVFVELGDGWEAVVFESEVEFDFIEKNLRTNQDQEYFVNGSFRDQLLSILYPEVAIGITEYSPGQKGNMCIV